MAPSQRWIVPLYRPLQALIFSFGRMDLELLPPTDVGAIGVGPEPSSASNREAEDGTHAADHEDDPEDSTNAIVDDLDESMTHGIV